MKDKEARIIINLLNERIKYLQKEIAITKHPHPKGCRCDRCSGNEYYYDPFTVTNLSIGSWFKD